MTRTLLLLVVVLAFSACSKDQKATDDQIIQQYLSDNNLNATAVNDGLYYTIDTMGNGPQPNLSNDITVHYKGYYTDGVVFDETTTTPATFPLANLILGWQYGFQYFNEGSAGRLYIPSHLGYGNTPPAGIRPNAVLIFDVELIAVQ